MKVIKYIVLNSLFVAALWFGVVEGIRGALNLGLFLAWFWVVASLFTVSEDLREKIAAREDWTSVPHWVDLTLDVLILSFLVWHGFFWTGGFYALHFMLKAAMYEKVMEIRKEKQAEKPPKEPKPLEFAPLA